MSGKANTRKLSVVAAAKPVRRATGYTLAVLSPKEAIKATVPVRKTLSRVPSRHWKKSLEKNLIEEGLTPAKAKILVELAAS